jgi:hypothetical protein
MNDELQPHELQQKRARAVKTALVLAFIAVAIFVTFIGSAIFGR